MASSVSVIGKTTRVRGKITGTVDVEVQGLVDGPISVDGDVTIDVKGMVGASVRGRRLIVRGAVKGDLLGEESVLLDEGARVVGDVKAPRIAIATGALVRGFIDTGDAGDAVPRAARVQQASAQPQATLARRVPPTPARTQPAQPPPKPLDRPADKATVKPADALEPPMLGHTNSDVPSNGPRRPPPPVVPALKKVKGQIATKKKER